MKTNLNQIYRILVNQIAGKFCQGSKIHNEKKHIFDEEYGKIGKFRNLIQIFNSYVKNNRPKQRLYHWQKGGILKRSHIA